MVEFESLMRSTFRATSHIARLLNNIPGKELAEAMLAGLLEPGKPLRLLLFVPLFALWTKPKCTQLLSL